MSSTPFNDTSSPLALALTRRSGKARDMGAPGPDAAQLETILAAAMRVPDHGKLAPWRFVVIPEDRRDAFAALLTSAYRAECPGASDAQVQAMDDFARMAPCLVVLLSTPVVPHKIPLWEQQLSAGAAAMALLGAAHGHGFVGNWLTGWPAYSPTVMEALGATGGDDRIAGFVFIGTPLRDLEERPRPNPSDVVRSWNGK